MSALSAAFFHDEAAAFEKLESLRGRRVRPAPTAAVWVGSPA